MECLNELYNYIELPYPNGILTDHDKPLIIATSEAFPSSKILLYIQHVNNNVTTNYKKLFLFDNDQEAFSEDQKKVIYTRTEEAFDIAQAYV